MVLSDTRQCVRVLTATAGTFGYCMQIVASFSSTASSSSSSSSRTPTPDRCSPASIGYDPADAVSAVSILRSASAREPHLTRVMILHPLATASTFFALATALFPSRLVPAPVPPALSMLSTVLLLAALVCDFVLFGGLRRRLEIASLRPSLRPRCSGTPPPWGPSTRGSGPCWRRRCACSSGLWCWSCGGCIFAGCACSVEPMLRLPSEGTETMSSLRTTRKARRTAARAPRCRRTSWAISRSVWSFPRGRR